MSVWKPIDDKAKDGGLYAVWFREPPCASFPNGYGYWRRSAMFTEGRWMCLDETNVFDDVSAVPEDHIATHYADMSPPESYTL